MNNASYTDVGQYKNINNEIIDFKFRKKLSYSELVYLIKTITDNCFDIKGDYEGYYYDFAKIQSIILSYTDIELPENTDERYEFVYSNKLDELFVGMYDEVAREENYTILDRKQIEFIEDESWQLVKYRKEKALNQSSLDDLLNSVTTYINAMTSQFEGLKMEDIKGFSELGETFKNIDKNDFMEKVIKFAKGESKTDK
jgi:hypothetical protein